MLTKKKLGGSKEAGDYYLEAAKQDDYYLQAGEPPIVFHDPAGVFQDILAHGEVINTTDKIAVYKKLLNGFHPRTGEPLVKNAGQTTEEAGERARNKGWDFTFSSPKSVDVAWGVGDDKVKKIIDDAQQQAIAKAIEYATNNLIFIRTGAGGKGPLKHVTPVVFLAPHGSSTGGDPMKHVHAVFANVGRAEDGKTGALHTEEFFRFQGVIAQIYHSEFAKNLEQKGIRTQKDGSFFKVVGIDKKVCDEFSRQHNEIVEKRGTNSRVGMGVQADEDIYKQTRKTLDHHKSGEMVDEWRARAKEFGVTEEKIAGLVRSQRDGMAPDLSALSARGPEEVADHEKARLDHVMAKLTETEAIFTRPQLLSALLTEFLGEKSSDEILALEKQLEVVELGEVDGQKMCSTKEMVEIERKMLEDAKAHTARPLDAVRIAKHLIDLDAEQKDCAKHILTTEKGVSIMEGRAGAGKTRTMQAIRAAYQEAAFRVHGTTLSWKASEALKAEGNLDESVAIQGFINKLEKGDIRLGAKDVLIIDEAGLVGSRHMQKLISYCKNSGTKLVIAGDTRQIEAVNAGGAMRALVQHLGSVDMNTVRRQHDKMDAEAGLAISLGKAGEAVAHYSSKGQLHLLNKKEDVFQSMAAEYVRLSQSTVPVDAKDPSKGRRDATVIVVAKTNADVTTINNTIRASLVSAGLVGKGTAITTSSGSIEIGKGDRIQFTSRSRNLLINPGSSVWIEPGKQTLLGIVDTKAQSQAFGVLAAESKKQATVISVNDNWTITCRLPNGKKTTVSSRRVSLNGDGGLAEQAVDGVVDLAKSASEMFRNQKNKNSVDRKDEYRINNRTEAIVESVNLDGSLTCLVDNKKITVRPSDFIDTSKRPPVPMKNLPIARGYCFTADSAQGQTKDAALLYGVGMDRKRAYVGATRHRHKLEIYADRESLHTSIARTWAKDGYQPAAKLSDEIYKKHLAETWARNHQKTSTLDFTRPAPKTEVPKPITTAQAQVFAARIKAIQQAKVARRDLAQGAPAR